jgi:hypothetical protein
MIPLGAAFFALPTAGSYDATKLAISWRFIH